MACPGEANGCIWPCLSHPCVPSVGQHDCLLLSRSLSSSSIPGNDAEPGVEPREEEEDEDFAKGDDLAYTDDLRDENYHPSLDRWESCEGACRYRDCVGATRWYP